MSFLSLYYLGHARLLDIHLSSMRSSVCIRVVLDLL